MIELSQVDFCVTIETYSSPLKRSERAFFERRSDGKTSRPWKNYWKPLLETLRSKLLDTCYEICQDGTEGTEHRGSIMSVLEYGLPTVCQVAND